MSDSNAVAEPELLVNGPWADSFFASVKAKGEFAETLRTAGYDPVHPAGQYPISVYLNLLDLVRSHLFPNLPPRDGYWQAGRRHVASYFESAIGKIQGLAFPLLGPERVIQSIVKQAPSTTNFSRAEAAKEGDKRWRLTFHPLHGIPAEFIAGGLEFGLEKAKTPTRRIVIKYSSAEDAADFLVTW